MHFICKKPGQHRKFRQIIGAQSSTPKPLPLVTPTQRLSQLSPTPPNKVMYQEGKLTAIAVFGLKAVRTLDVTSVGLSLLLLENLYI